MKLNIPFAAPLINIGSEAQTHRLRYGRIAPRAFVDRNCGIRDESTKKNARLKDPKAGGLPTHSRDFFAAALLRTTNLAGRQEAVIATLRKILLANYFVGHISSTASMRLPSGSCTTYSECCPGDLPCSCNCSAGSTEVFARIGSRLSTKKP